MQRGKQVREGFSCPPGRERKEGEGPGCIGREWGMVFLEQRRPEESQLGWGTLS